MIHMRRIRQLFTPLILTISAILFFIVPACTLQSRSEGPRLDRSANFTQAAQTLDAQLTLAAEGAFPTATRLSTQVGTTIPIITPRSPGDPPPEPNTDPGAVCDLGMFVDDISIPDGTIFEPGETFVKTWRLRNSGSCSWTSEYSVVFDAGDAMSGPAAFPLTQSNIAPGEEVDISINLTAPQEPGNYRGDWRLRNPAGRVFGLGSQGTASFWVVINIEEAPDLRISFEETHDCSGTETAIFKVVNTGNAPLDSVQITFNNLTSDNTIFGPFTSNGAFMENENQCPPGGDSIKSGNTEYIGGGLGSNPAAGNTIEAVFRFCSDEDLGGTCVNKTIEFEIP
jgi:hypothetical protein